MPLQIKSNNLSMYEDHAADWWKPNSSHFRSLFSVNKFRLELIRRWMPFNPGDIVVDLGCGGGFVAVPLDQEGVRIVGIDLSPHSLKVAKNRCTKSLGFIAADARSVPLSDGMADHVIVADLLDHVPDYELTIKECARILRPGGKVFVTTLNRNWFSALIAVHIGEGLGLVPAGTHDPKMFIKPEELLDIAAQYNLHFEQKAGAFPKIYRTIADWAVSLGESSSLRIFYALLLKKGSNE